MGVKTRGLTLALLLAALLPGCGDTILILGELPGIMRIVAGVSPDGAPANPRPAEETELLLPRAVAIDSTYQAYVVEQRGRVFRVGTGGSIELLLEPPFCGPTICPGRVEDAALDGQGGLLMTDGLSHRIYRFDIEQQTLSIIAGTGTRVSTPDGEPALGSPVASPTGIDVLDDGTIVFAETTSDRVRVITPAGILGTLAGTGEQGFTGDGGPASEARLSGPLCLTVRGAELFICDAGNYRIRTVQLGTGTIQTIAGSGVSGFLGDGGPATQARFGLPAALAVTADGRTLFISDTQNRRVRRVHLPSGMISTYAGDGTAEFRASGMPPADTPLELPAGLAVNDLNLLYILDRGLHLVWRVSLGL